MFFLKKVRLILFTGLLVVSCSQPDDNKYHHVSESIPVSSQADMAKIGVEETHPLSGTYLLANDITLDNWLPIGDEENPFTGVFDGNGSKITLNSFDETAVSEKTYLGIFGYVKGASASAKTVIKNLTIDSTVDAASISGQYTGLVTGRAELAEIEKITLTGTFDFRSEKTIFVGGVAGWISGKGSLIKDSNSSLTMNIVPGSDAADSSYSYVGGIAGTFRSGAGIENCHNTGDVTADNTLSAAAVAGQVFAGGIAGGSYYGFSTAYHGYINDSSFTGTLIGRAKGYWTFAGGIAGTICGGTINDIAATTRIERCFVTGTVSTAGTDSGYPYTGGVVGYNYYGALVSQSYFNGEVIGESGSPEYTGGIAGYNSQTESPNNSRIEDCWSGGTVTGVANAGGIVGQNQVNTYVRRCYSTAEVSVTGSTGTGIGGIAGMNASAQPDAITACVALNPSLTAPRGNNINRVTGTTGGIRSNNYAWSGMDVSTGGRYTERKGLTNAGGEDCVEKPEQAFYESLGWDFTNVWKMGTDYPQLKWQ